MLLHAKYGRGVAAVIKWMLKHPQLGISSFPSNLQAVVYCKKAESCRLSCVHKARAQCLQGHNPSPHGMKQSCEELLKQHR